jgi:Mn2+/Fe2+ NRAMP family transporter
MALFSKIRMFVRKIHLFSGISVLVVFAITGQYMMHALDLQTSKFDAQRMMYRASHIYLLWAGAINTLLGCYWVKVQGEFIPKVQAIASVLIVFSQVFLLLAFYVEPPAIDQDRLLTLAGCLCLLVGVVLTLGITFASRKFNATTKN